MHSLYSAQIPVCFCFLAQNKNADAKRGLRDRRDQILANHTDPAFTNSATTDHDEKDNKTFESNPASPSGGRAKSPGPAKKATAS